MVDRREQFVVRDAQTVCPVICLRSIRRIDDRRRPHAGVGRFNDSNWCELDHPVRLSSSNIRPSGHAIQC